MENSPSNSPKPFPQDFDGLLQDMEERWEFSDVRKFEEYVAFLSNQSVNALSNQEPYHGPEHLGTTFMITAMIVAQYYYPQDHYKILEMLGKILGITVSAKPISRELHEHVSSADDVPSPVANNIRKIVEVKQKREQEIEQKNQQNDGGQTTQSKPESHEGTKKYIPILNEIKQIGKGMRWLFGQPKKPKEDDE